MNRLSKWAMHVKRAGRPSWLWAVRLALIVAMAVLVAGLYLAQASQMSTTGRQLESMREQHDQLKRENAELLYLISRDANIASLQQRSAAKGLVPAENIVYLAVNSGE
ncbi:MAG: hypothetical protein JW850_09285 [Thermoflexales bacterium]|nr:hypothetical protein [Thermoflexales bacterium]